MGSDEKRDKWIRSLGIIEGEVQSLVIAKQVFWDVQALIKTNSAIQKQSVFYWYLGDTYIAYALMGIRRHTKRGADSISFAQLLGEIEQEPICISREFFRSLYEDSRAHFADRHFDQFCDAAGNPHISGTQVRRDLENFKAVALGCEGFADRKVAHRDLRPPKTLPTFRDVDTAIDTLHQLVLKYHRILLGDYIETLLPTYQYDWKEIFDYPWRMAGNPQSEINSNET